MAKKNTSEAQIAGAITKRTCKPRELSATSKDLLDKLKESKKLDKVLILVPELSPWGCAQVLAALHKHPSAAELFPLAVAAQQVSYPSSI